MRHLRRVDGTRDTVIMVHAALVRPGHEPGRYVSAGPLPHLVDVWRAVAPSIDLLTPDIYFPNFSEWVGRDRRTGLQLFVPEAMLTPQAAANALFAVGAHEAIGFSPFSIASATGASEAAITRAYDLLEGLAPILLAHQGRGTIAGVMPPVAFDGTLDESPQQVAPGGRWTLTVSFAPNGPGAPNAGILAIDEGRYVRGRWIPGRCMNGDQSHQGRRLRIFANAMTVQRVRLYR